MSNRLCKIGSALIVLAMTPVSAQVVIENQSVNVGSVTIGKNASVGSVVIDGKSVDTTNGVLQGNGKLGTKHIRFGAVSELIVDVPATVNVTRDDKTRLTISADANLLDSIAASQKDNSLRIYGTQPFMASSPITLQLTVPQLSSVVIRSAADVSMKEVSTRELKIVIDGTGDVQATGRVDNVVGIINGTGNLQLSKLASKAGIISINGTGDAVVDITDELSAAINGVGDIVYLRRPKQVKQKIKGVGEVRIAASDD